jgi:hypothetical protein
MDRADEVVRTRRLPPAVRQWGGSIRLSEAPTSKHEFRSYKLRRHRPPPSPRFYGSRHYAIPPSEDYGLHVERDCSFVTEATFARADN